MSKANLAVKKRPLTDEDYLRLERQASEKSEFIDGKIVAMAGASDKHNLISSNLMIEIGVKLKEGSCRVFSSDMRVKARKGSYYYPDLLIVCGDRKYEDNKKDSLLNPKVIVEILSKSTKLKDRNEKLDSYTLLESVTDYVLISQDDMRIEHFIKNGEKEWKVRFLTEKTDKLIFDSVNCEVLVEEIYKEVLF